MNINDKASDLTYLQLLLYTVLLLLLLLRKRLKWHCHISDVAGALNKIKLDILWH